MAHNHNKNLQQTAQQYYDSEVVPDWLKAVYVTPELGTDFPFGHARMMAVRSALSYSGLQHQHAVDIGCGGGQLSIELARHGAQVLALDFSAAMLEQAAQNVAQADLCDKVRFKRHDLLNDALPEDFSKVTMAIAMGLIEYLPQDEAFFAKAADIVADDGWLLVEFRNGAFNAASANQFTLQAMVTGELEGQVAAYHQFCLESEIEVAHILQVANAYGAAAESMTGQEKTGQVDKFTQFFPGKRRQHLLPELCAVAAQYGFEAKQCLGLHPHPFNPTFERQAPRQFNQIAWALQQYPANPLVVSMCSSGALLLQKRR